MFATDHYFHIGSDHLTNGKPCQDYALSGICGSNAYAIVSDGCSTGRHTDVGSRILTFATAQAMLELPARYSGMELEPHHVSSVQQGQMFNSMLTLGLSRDDMLATCVCAYLTPRGGFVHLQGDGVVALRSANGETHIFRYDWADNMPLYAAYAVDNYGAFIRGHGGEIGAKKLIEQHWVFNPDGSREELPGHEHTLAEGIRGVTIPLAIHDLGLVAVFTDGVTQIEGVDWKEAVREALAFKTVAGEFVKRRMIRLVSDRRRTGKGPVDDIACAVIRVVNQEE